MVRQGTANPLFGGSIPPAASIFKAKVNKIKGKMLKTVEPTKLKKEDVLKTLKEYKSYLRERFGVKEIGLFGSFAREEQTEGSDIDILVDVERNKMGLVSYVKLKLFLEELFGRKVDLVTKKALRPELKETILREVVYV